MMQMQRALMIGTAGLVLLSGCKFGGMSGSGTETVTSGPSTTPPPSTGSGNPGIPSGNPSPALTQNDVEASVSDAGTVSVAVGTRRTISLTFTSSDGRAATGFAISGTTLPAGWSGPDEFTCASVSLGSDCILNLTYAPTALESGTFVVNFLYIDAAGVRKTPGGSVSIPYQSTAANNVTATVSPLGQVNSRVGGGTQSVSVNFTTDDGFAATDFQMATDLQQLPAGWSSASPALTCAAITTGNGCELLLNFVPNAAGAGVLRLDYSYTDRTGAPRTGALNIPYSATPNHIMTATVAPAGQINAVQKNGHQPVVVTFTTDDGKPLSKLYVLTDLGALPDGWSSAESRFHCDTVSTGNGCALHLTYSPDSLAGGTLGLQYMYEDQGKLKAGTINIDYAGTTDDNVVGTVAPSGQINAIVGAGSQPVTVTFTSDDDRQATDLTVLDDLTTLPGGWSGAQPGFNCAAVSSGVTCQLLVTYAPAQADAGTLVLHYGYRNNAGQPKTGSINIPYRATTDDNVVATALPATVAAITGNSVGVPITFTTDDGNPATNLQITAGLDSLPAEWSAAAPAFSCASVSVGTGCQLTLTYSPTVVAAGTLTLQFSALNNSGILKTGSVTVSYSAALPVP